MTAPFLARLLVTAVSAGQGIAALCIDLNRTHATNPLWTGHARFHVVQQTFTSLAAAIVEVVLLWAITPARFFFYLATLLAALPMIAFVIAMFSKRLYAGALHDPNGMRPVPIRIGSRVRQVDMNIVLIIVGMAVLMTAVMIF